MRNESSKPLVLLVLLALSITGISFAQLGDVADTVDTVTDIIDSAAPFPSGEYRCFPQNAGQGDFWNLPPRLQGTQLGILDNYAACEAAASAGNGNLCPRIQCTSTSASLIQSELGTVQECFDTSDRPCYIYAHGSVGGAASLFTQAVPSLIPDLTATHAVFTNVDMSRYRWFATEASLSELNSGTKVGQVDSRFGAHTRITDVTVDPSQIWAVRPNYIATSNFLESTNNEIASSRFAADVVLGGVSLNKISGSTFQRKLTLKDGLTENEISGSTIDTLEIVASRDSGNLIEDLVGGSGSISKLPRATSSLLGLVPGQSQYLITQGIDAQLNGNTVTSVNFVANEAPGLPNLPTLPTGEPEEAVASSINIVLDSNFNNVRLGSNTKNIFSGADINSLELSGKTEVSFIDVTDATHALIKSIQTETGIPIEEILDDILGSTAPADNPTSVGSLTVKSGSNVKVDGSVSFGSVVIESGATINRKFQFFILAEGDNIVTNAEACVLDENGEVIGDCKNVTAAGFVETDYVPFTSTSQIFTLKITKTDPATGLQLTLFQGPLVQITMPSPQTVILLSPLSPGNVGMNLPAADPLDPNNYQKLVLNINDRSQIETHFVVFYRTDTLAETGISDLISDLPSPIPETLSSLEWKSLEIQSANPTGTGLQTHTVVIPDATPNAPLRIAVAAKNGDTGTSLSTPGDNENNPGTNLIYTHATKPESGITNPGEDRMIITFTTGLNPPSVNYELTTNPLSLPGASTGTPTVICGTSGLGVNLPSLPVTTPQLTCVATILDLDPNVNYGMDVTAINSDGIPAVPLEIAEWTLAQQPLMNNENQLTIRSKSVTLRWNPKENPSYTKYSIYDWTEIDPAPYIIKETPIIPITVGGQPGTENPTPRPDATDLTGTEVTIPMECNDYEVFGIHGFNGDQPPVRTEYAETLPVQLIDTEEIAEIYSLPEAGLPTSASLGQYTPGGTYTFTIPAACLDHYHYKWQIGAEGFVSENDNDGTLYVGDDPIPPEVRELLNLSIVPKCSLTETSASGDHEVECVVPQLNGVHDGRWFLFLLPNNRDNGPPEDWLPQGFKIIGEILADTKNPEVTIDDADLLGWINSNIVVPFDACDTNIDTGQSVCDSDNILVDGVGVRNKIECDYKVTNYVAPGIADPNSDPTWHELPNCQASFTVSVGGTGQCYTQGIDACKVTLRSIDSAGNEGLDEILPDIDYTPPVTIDNSEDVIDNIIDWQGDNPIINLSCSDSLHVNTPVDIPNPVQSCQNTWFCVSQYGQTCDPRTNGELANIGGVPLLGQALAPFDCPAGQACRLNMFYQSEDIAGNLELAKELIIVDNCELQGLADCAVKIDLAVPSQATGDAFSPSPRTITTNSNEGQDIGSGVSWYTFKLTGSDLLSPLSEVRTTERTWTFGSPCTSIPVEELRDVTGNNICVPELPSPIGELIQLKPNQSYSSTIKWEDDVGNVGPESIGITKYTLAIPGIGELELPEGTNAAAARRLIVHVGDSDNPSGTQYAIKCLTSLRNNCNVGEFLKKNGQVWNTKDDWNGAGGNGHTITGLLPNTEHSVQVISRNGDSIESPGEGFSRFTRASPVKVETEPSVPLSNTVRIEWNADENPGNTRHHIERREFDPGLGCDNDNGFITPPGGDDVQGTFFTDNTATGVPGTVYQYRITSENEDDIEADPECTITESKKQAWILQGDAFKLLPLNNPLVLIPTGNIQTNVYLPTEVEYNEAEGVLKLKPGVSKATANFTITINPTFQNGIVNWQHFKANTEGPVTLRWMGYNALTPLDPEKGLFSVDLSTIPPTVTQRSPCQNFNQCATDQTRSLQLMIELNGPTAMVKSINVTYG